VAIPQISAWASSSVAVMAHEAGRGTSYSPDRVRVCVSCNRVKNCHAYEAVLPTILVAACNIFGTLNFIA
jgi:hypothetical protein